MNTRAYRAADLISGVIATAAIFVASPASLAAPITIEATGTVTSVTLQGGSLELYFPSVPKVGDSYTFRYTYESTTPDAVPADLSQGIYANALTALSLTVGSNPAFDFPTLPQPQNNIEIGNTGTGDFYNVLYSGASLTPNFTIDLISGFNTAGTAFTSDALPSIAPNIALFGGGGPDLPLFQFQSNQLGGSDTLKATVTNLSLVPPTGAVFYQPTPYSNVVPLAYHHIWDGWLNSFFPAIMTFQQNDFLQLGGWGDTYRVYVRFDTRGLPQIVTRAVLRLMPSLQSGTAPEAFIYLVTGPWDAATTPARPENPPTTATTAMTWATQPGAIFLMPQAAPVLNTRWDIDITAQYNEWQTRPENNFGIRIDPRVDNSPAQSIMQLRSSRYSDFAPDPLADGKRPVLHLEFTPPPGVPNLKMPLPGTHRWQVTTEVGGTDCVGPQSGSLWPDTAHTDPELDPNKSATLSNYFAIDFSANIPDHGATVFAATDVPILAAADGIVAEVGKNEFNGNYIVLNHSGQTDPSVGYTTRYLHLRDAPARQDGTKFKNPKKVKAKVNGKEKDKVEHDTVVQGDQIGIMGTTGRSTGIHLHFGVRYNGSGNHAVPELSYVVMDGLLLKSFQTECDTAGIPIRYYRSQNRVY
jgi:hypothetical protein